MKYLLMGSVLIIAACSPNLSTEQSMQNVGSIAAFTETYCAIYNQQVHPLIEEELLNSAFYSDDAIARQLLRLAMGWNGVHQSFLGLDRPPILRALLDKFLEASANVAEGLDAWATALETDADPLLAEEKLNDGTRLWEQATIALNDLRADHGLETYQCK